jgi:hypothetical protein
VFVAEPPGIVKLNADTLHKTGQQPVGGPRGYLTGLVYGGGSLWVVEYHPNVVLRIDPTSLQVLHTTPLQGRPWGQGFGDGHLWITITRPSTNHGTQHLLERISPTTGDVTGHTVLNGTADSAEIVVGNVIAVTGYLAPHIQLIDPATMGITRTVSSRGTRRPHTSTGLLPPPGLGSLDGQIYLIKSNGTVVRLSNEGPQRLVFTPWAHIHPYVLPMSSAAGRLWIAGNGRLYGFDPDVGAVTAVITIPGVFGALPDSGSVLSNGPILTEASKNGTDYTLDRLMPAAR